MGEGDHKDIGGRPEESAQRNLEESCCGVNEEEHNKEVSGEMGKAREAWKKEVALPAKARTSEEAAEVKPPKEMFRSQLSPEAWGWN